MKNGTEQLPGAPPRWLDRIFDASLLLKGLFAFAELASGLALFWAGTGLILNIAQWATLEELSEDPSDLVATSLLQAASAFSIESKTFYALYLAAHGVVKLLIVAGLWRRVRLAFPVGAAALLLFVAYQLYRFSQTGSPGLLALSAFDLFIVALIWRENKAFGPAT